MIEESLSKCQFVTDKLSALRSISILDQYSFWIVRSGLYFLVCIFLYFICYLIRLNFGFSTINCESARSALSSLVQGEAAILAIVISLSLVAVQQTASSYSPRVVDIFKDTKRNPDFFILIIVYIISIAYGTWVLIQTKGTGNELTDFSRTLVFDSFEDHVWFVYFLSIFALVSLAIYIKSTLNLLNPYRVIDIISINIDEDVIKSHINGNVNNNCPIEQICDIIRSSLVRKDCITANYGLKKIMGKISQVKAYDVNNSTLITPARIISFFTETAKVAISLGDQGTTLDTINYIKNITINEPELKNNGIRALKEIGIEASEHRLVDVTNEVASFFKEIGLREIEEWKKNKSLKQQ